MFDRFNEIVPKRKKFLRDFWLSERAERPACVPFHWVGEPQMIGPKEEMLEGNYLYFRLNEHLPGDFVPVILPWLGNTVLAEAFGCEIAFPEGGQPMAKPVIGEDYERVCSLEVPDASAGRMSQIYDYIRFYDKTGFPVRVTDTQGPLDITA